MIIMVSLKWKRIWKKIITVVLIFCITSMAVTGAVYDMIFARYDKSVQVPEALADMVGARTQLSFFSGENKLAGYYYESQQPAQANGLVVFVPGFHAGGDDYLWQIQSLLSYGWGVFTFDATGTFGSEGKNQVGFSQIVRDLESALKYIENNDNFGYNDVVLIGHSRGAYAACCVVKQQNVSAVVAISGINSAMDAVMQPAEEAVGLLSYGNYGFLWLYQAVRFGPELLNREASEEIAKTQTPVLVIHGSKDTSVPADENAIIAYRQQPDSAQVEYLLCDAGHTDILYDADGTANDALMSSIHAFLIRSLKN